jgi:HD superfamily phosphodiesterase
MNLAVLISSSEKKLAKLLEEFFKSNYDERKLPSHGIDHHRRVWNYAQEILQTLHLDEIDDPRIFVDKLLIACYLHDSGMAVESGEKHGFESRKLCEMFLSRNNLKKVDYEDVLNAIENHDNKEYQIAETEDKLLLILSVADDLDAFGYIGIYRYIEIYLARGILPDKIGQMVRDNAQKRFNNFRLNFSGFPELLRKHEARYLVLDKFFEGLNKELGNIE